MASTRRPRHETGRPCRLSSFRQVIDLSDCITYHDEASGQFALQRRFGLGTLLLQPRSAPRGFLVISAKAAYPVPVSLGGVTRHPLQMVWNSDTD